MDVKIKICKVVSKTQYSPLCKLQSGEYWVLLATLPSAKIRSIFQQCNIFRNIDCDGIGTGFEIPT